MVDGTIDAGYTGSISIVIFNFSPIKKVFEKGDKVAQLVLQKIKTPTLVEVESFEDTERGDGGFGSTGR